MERRKFVIGMGSLVAGGAAATGTGAMNVFSADRDATIEVVDDSEAYVGLYPGDDDQVTDSDSTESGGYAKLNDSGALEITIDELNPEAETKFINVFRIANQVSDDDVDWGGSPEVGLSFSLSGGNASAVEVLVHKGVGSTVNDDGTGYDASFTGGSGDGDVGVLTTGTVAQVDLQIDTSGLDDGDSIADTLTVNAEEPEGTNLS